MKNIYINRAKYFFFLHVFSLVITGVVTTAMLYQKYVYGEVKKDIFYKYKEFERNTESLRLYFRYTGTETGFGFFAPNVKSHEVLFFESCNNPLELTCETYEGSLRYDCLISSTTDYVMDEITGKEKKGSLRQQYSDLLLQNLVSKVQQINESQNDCKTVTVTYRLLEFPPLELKNIPKKPELISLKNWIYETK